MLYNLCSSGFNFQVLLIWDMFWLTSWVVLVTFSGVVVSLSDTPYFNYFFPYDPFSVGLLWLITGLVMALVSGKSSSLMKYLLGSLMMILFLSFGVSSIFYFYMLFELSLIPILVMILSQGGQPERLSAGAYLIFYTTVISIPYLAVVIVFTLPMLNMSMNSLCNSAFWCSMILLSPFLVKMPMFGVHFWLPKAHVEANTSGSMVLAGLLLKLGSYGATRMSILSNLSLSLAWISSSWVILAFLASIITFMQTDFKKMVAYSSVTHMTFMVVGIATNSKCMLVSILLVSLAHGWVAMGLFLMAGMVSHGAGSRLYAMMGAESSLSSSMIIFGVLLISNASVPPMPSFFAEVLMLLGNLVKSGLSSLIFLCLSFSVCYYNSYMFLCLSQVKPLTVLSSSMKLTNSLTLFLTLGVSLEALVWMMTY